MFSEPLRITRINYEVFVHGGRLVVSPSMGVSHEPVPNGFKLTDFSLPSNQTQYGGIVYQDFERLLAHTIDLTLQTDQRYQGLPRGQARKKLVEDFTRGNLNGSVKILKELTDEIVSRYTKQILEEYDQIGLPRTELLREAGA